MSEQRWTPGPWRQVTGVGYCAIRTNAGVIADIRFVDRQYNPFDANLIAAAPELFEALEYALPYLRACAPSPRDGINQDGSVDVNCVDRALAAIAKARGE
ncbi:MAG: hypothetical protein U9Q35_01155 [Pseudomonadota bacterium]|nr:hypothetical protein [Pseudomonadota bacterium]